MEVNPENPKINDIYKIKIGDTEYFKGEENPLSIIEYDFSYIVPRIPDNQFIVSEIDNYTKEQGWKNIFPTSIEVEEEEGKQYFGYLGNLYFLEIGPSSGIVEIYDSTGNMVTIDFSDHENRFWKFLYFYISATKVLSINLSYEAWKIDKDPYRNRSQYVLKDLDNYTINPVNESGVDKRSGTLLGNIVEENTPILRKKIRKLNYVDYSPKIVYSSGDEAKYNNKTYISISDHNVGNYPVISKEWMLKS
jgi:hypothetical protein